MRGSCGRWMVGLALVAGLTGCDEQMLSDLGLGSQPPASVPPGTPSPGPAGPASPGDTVRIASFNIQVFGTSKLRKPHVTDVLARVVRQFDVVAVQELRSADQTVIPEFLRLVNADGSRYDSVVGPLLGRTSSKEQYVYLYDTRRIELVQGSVGTVPDPDDWLHREPFVASFRVRGPLPGQAFGFTLVNIHTDPDETDEELDALARVFMTVQRQQSGEDDVILLGDLNVSERKLGDLGRLPGIYCAIRGVPTNTRRTATYDNIVFDARATTEYAGRGGVLDLMQQFGLTVEQALDVSDHMPVWAEFRAVEGGGGMIAAEETPERR